MSDLRPEFYISSNVRADNMGDSIPPWFSNVNDKSTWYNGQNEVNYYFYNLVNNGSSSTNVDYTVYIQYGHNTQGWATVKFFVYKVSGIVTNIGTSKDKNLNANITFNSFWSRLTDTGTGNVSVIWNIYVLGYRVGGYTGDTGDEFTTNPNENVNSNIIIPYGGSTTQTCLNVTQTYPNGDFPNTNIEVGVRLFNDLDPEYYPLAYRNFNNNVRYTSFNDIPNKTTAIRKSDGSLVKFPILEYDNQNVSGVGNFRYRESSNLRQVPLVESRNS